ncbi:MAG: ABC-F family ATP-binding cassette domain-containing protein [Clostridia bacterium]|nr:ABC-F family ATP-binding cassette domain-containing protein [Clostridia bacterium]
MSKIILEAHDIRKGYGASEILNIDGLRIYEGEKIGMIGENGAGKSTLMAILSGDLAPDEGAVRRMCDISVIRQMGEEAEDGDRKFKAEFRAPENRAGLSGGEQTRRRIAAALSRDAGLLLADEPTTDLDAQGIGRLTKHLMDYRGAMVLISHDRTLLNSVCSRIWQLEDGKITDFPGNYDAWLHELERRRSFQQFEYDQYRSEQARLKAAAQKMQERTQQVKKAPSRMGNSEARLHKREATDAILRLSHGKRTLLNRMEQMEKKERPRDLPDIRMKLGAGTPVGAKNVLRADGITIKAGERVLLEKQEINLPTGSRTALIGPNGCGKTSLLRALMGEKGGGTFKGRVRFNDSAKTGWFDQNHDATLDMRMSALDNVMTGQMRDASLARTVLARLNMGPEEIFRSVGVLSGGERAKIAIAKLLLSDANVLFLDEPTNHLDVFTLEALEEMLEGYAGTLMFVSHDRRFIRRLATRIIRMEDGKLKTFEGGLEAMENAGRADASAEKRRLEIAALEMRLAALAGRMGLPGEDMKALSDEYDALALKLRTLKSEK